MLTCCSKLIFSFFFFIILYRNNNCEPTLLFLYLSLEIKFQPIYKKDYNFVAVYNKIIDFYLLVILIVFECYSRGKVIFSKLESMTSVNT